MNTPKGTKAKEKSQISLPIKSQRLLSLATHSAFTLPDFIERSTDSYRLLHISIVN
ncbi:MAG: hypothetical protein ACI87J_002047 [Colwellia sp.]|jgi:hypothetical protein